MKYRNDLKKRILAGLLAGAALCLTAPAAQAAGSPVSNGTLPDGGKFVAGQGTIGDPVNGKMDIHQNTQNAVITWDKGFNIGANATVNFTAEGAYKDNFNTLNYDKSGSLSQIYGTINAQGGNIYIVNPNGVEIGNSAQINTGSLYVSNKNLDDKIYEGMDIPQDMDAFVRSGQSTDAALMSLGNINATTKVTFEGSRIVIDTERIKDENGDKKLGADKITIRTNDASNVVIGYDAYNEGENKGTFAGKNKDVTDLATVLVNGTEVGEGLFNAYMWVEDIEQLQAINTNLSGNYALRNSIDATATQDWNVNAGTGIKEGFQSLGTSAEAFTGKFDGLDYNIFNLKINRETEDNVGLFGVVGNDAVINNVTLVGGSITGGTNVGALAGSVQGSAHISNITNSASVTGTSNVGGIAGSSDGSESTGLINTGTIKAEKSTDASNAGGLIGSMNGGTLGGESYNLGAVSADNYNVGGLVGHAVNSIIGNKDTINEDGQTVQGMTVYNRLNVTGAYNVGGIVGNMEGSTVQNAENSGDVTSTGYLDGTYMYHTDRNSIEGYDTATKTASIGVQIANVGGIVGNASDGSTITNALNAGNVSSESAQATETVANVNDENKTEDVTYTYYTAGNVGGIVGSAVDTDITNATNQENEIRGAHNVGGIAGYFANSESADKMYSLTNGINDGGDIMATGARATGTGSLIVNGFAQEHIRPGDGGKDEHFNIGNTGGIVGYMSGDNVYIASSANRGTVHTLEPENAEYVSSASKAANVGGIVGKIDRSSAADDQDKQDIREDYSKAAVSNSYNTGDVMGYTGVGGIAGMMYNGEIAGSYNLGYLRTTRQSTVGGSIDALNMGGIVGDTTENGSAKVFLYDVYNKGQIGDSQFDYFGRHVGGIVGRLTGDVEKAYNTGDIYNGYNVVGGIVGWLSSGSIKDSFNTGNITVINRNNASSQVGGIAGAASTSISSIVLDNVYNLGTIRSFKASIGGDNKVGGILGIINGNGKYEVSISNAYTTGNIWAGQQYWAGGGYAADNSGTIRSIWGGSEVKLDEGMQYNSVNTENTYYIRPDDGLPFTDLSANNRDNSDKAIAFDKKDDITEYQYGEGENHHQLFQTNTEQNEVNESDAWRIYDGSTPILNAFLPNAKEYFDKEDMDKIGIGSIQYGTAYDPLLTIINAANGTTSLTFNWQELGINNDAGLAVYGAGLTLNDFMSTGGSGYFGGLIYSDGALNINAHTSGGTHDEANTNVTGNVALGSASELYGSSVTIDADGQVTIYGSVTATGNGTTDENNPAEDNSGSISITGGSMDVYGQLTSAEAEKDVFVPGINGMAAGWTPGKVKDPKEAMSDIGDRFGYTTGKSAVTGNISITATDAEDGHVNVYYGNKGEGIVNTGGDLTVTASGDIYMDSDLSIGGDLTLNAGQLTNPDGTTSTAEGSEAVLDISNIGKVQAENGVVQSAKEGLHNFLDHFAQDGKITLGGDETKIAVDMWGGDSFNLQKYDLSDEEKDTLAYKLNQLNINGEKGKGKKYTYIWVSTGEQLAGIQDYKDKHQDSNILSYNFALKNDIDASNVRDYKAIGTGSAYTGTFDGRDNRIIGLTMTGDNAGIFDTIGADGTVEDLRVYSGTFSGTDSAGAVAGVNNGKISNVTAFGNVVQSAGNAGGIAGKNGTTDTENSAEITNASAIGTATADGQNAIAGGIAGTNTGTISDSSANSAVNASAGNAAALGGVAGVNKGTLDNVDSLGVTTGVYKVEGKDTLYSDNVGGIAGTNSGTVTNVYNESIVSGRDNVGGILGVNTATAVEDEGSPVSNVANASRVTGEANPNAAEDKDKTSDYVGGLVGNNEGSITNGRNNGEITGNNYVGGLVGSNGADSTLTNLVNDSAAAITGDNYVGGIAGSNAGTVSAENQTNLINRGSITGQNYVGGVAGENIGTIEYVKSDINLNVRYKDQDAKYFGGVAGINGKATEGGTTINTGTITNATNTADIIAPDADFVGGIVGWNTSAGKLEGMGNSNEGRVEGASHVGGVAGLNEADIKGTVDAMVGIFNSGVVIAHKGGAGGIFGENTGAISHAELTNNGIVSGTYSDEAGENGTGGIFGVNSGDVTYSSLKNEIGGQVMGTQNVGGLIGVNSGNITGGRTEADNTDVGYYKYQIYNNGTINAGTWDDKNKDGVVDEGEFTEATTNSQNIAGLFGVNQKRDNGTGGEVTAAYNTGAIVANNSTNVGGIAGTNAGTLDQVFNTVITADGQKQTITGSTNVGGIAGTNNGSISNAYNTTEVKGAVGSTGSIAGTNSNTADDSIRNVYGTGTLVGSGSDSVSNDYDISDTSGNKDWKDSDSYTGFDFDGDDAVWKIYEGSTNPLLKVFLTKVTVDADTDLGLVYNGKDQDINLGDFISHTGINAADKFAAYKNNNSLIQNTNGEGFEHKNADTYSNWLYSSQIAASTTGEDDSFNPNNLGYDIDFTQDIDKAVIKVDGNTVDRTYGSTAIDSSTDGTGHLIGGNKGYGFIVSGTNTGEFTDEMKAELTDENLGFDATQVSDSALSTETGRVTNDVSDNYTWSATLSLSDALKSNYEFYVENGAGTDSTEVSGSSHVNQAKLTITLDDVNRVYGNTAIKDNGNYDISKVEGLTNGDSGTFTLAEGADIQDGAIVSTSDGDRTNDVKDGGYTWTVGTDDGKNLSDNFSSTVADWALNYEIEVVEGKSSLERKEITLGDLAASIMYGNQDGKGLTVNGGPSLAAGGVVYGDDLSLSGNASYMTGGSYASNKGNRDTADVGTYTDSLFVSGLTLDGTKAGNYTLKTDTAVGSIEVTKATLNVSLGEVDRVYGNMAVTNGGYTAGIMSGLVNGDESLGYTGNDLSVTVTDDKALTGNSTGKVTNSAGDYTWSGTVSGKDGNTLTNLSKNYDIKVNDGVSKVTPKQIVIAADDKTIYAGGALPTFTGTDISSQLANGDTLDELGLGGYYYGTEPAVDTSIGNTSHPIGLWAGNSFYPSELNGFNFTNYDVKFTPGTLTVLVLPLPEEEIPRVENHWNGLLRDNPWDRNRDFRERKAEIHYIAGGMTL